MRKKGNGASAAYYLDISTEQKTRVKTYSLPRLNSLIVMNEMCSDRRLKGERGCYFVAGETSSCIILKELYSPEIAHNRSFLKSDFIRGYYRYVEVEEPIYKCDTTWIEFELDVEDAGA